MKTYETLSEAINDLQKKGYNHDFNIADNCIECKSRQVNLKADEFEIDEVYRFEGETNPSDQSILYAISAMNGTMKGLLVNAYGVYSDSLSAELVSKLQRHQL